MLLTDGEVWDSRELYSYIEEVTAKGDVRLFSLGIGRDVSHSLVESMARIGRGFAQIVSDEKEGMEGKVVRMLKGGLSAHIKDYRLDWEGRPREEDLNKRSEERKSSSPKINNFSLFDQQADTDAPVSFTPLADFLPPRYPTSTVQNRTALPVLAFHRVRPSIQ